MNYQKILDFWFKEIEMSAWWTKNPTFDDEIIRRFSAIHSQAIAGELFHWRKTAQGSLAEIIVLDQFSRNMFRDQPQSFAFDVQALTLAQIAIEKEFDLQVSAVQRSFIYMPFMHSESSLIHEQAVSLFEKLGIDATLDFEMKHKIIIDRFGRYPHRNDILGRKSTQEEIEFLRQPDSSF